MYVGNLCVRASQASLRERHVRTDCVSLGTYF
jgi:hypothetical protein